jgi:exodeoxyribonuclease-5
VESLSAEDFEAQLIEAVHSRDYQENPDHVRALAWTNRRVRELNGVVRQAVYGDLGRKNEYLAGERLCANSSIFRFQNVLVATGEIVTVLDAQRGVDEHGVPIYQLLVQAESGKIPCNVVQSSGWDTYHKVLSEARKEAGALEERKKMDACWSDAQESARRSAWVRFFTVKDQYVDLRPPFASTVHKAQGMTLDQAFIDVADIGQCTRWYDAIKLMYVALTRARFRAVLTGALPERIQEACYAEWSQAAQIATGTEVQSR